MTVIAGDARELADADWDARLSVPRNWKRQRVKHLVRSMRAGDAITVDAIEPTGTYPVYGANGLRGFTSIRRITASTYSSVVRARCAGCCSSFLAIFGPARCDRRDADFQIHVTLDGWPPCCMS